MNISKMNEEIKNTMKEHCYAKADTKNNVEYKKVFEAFDDFEDIEDIEDIEMDEEELVNKLQEEFGDGDDFFGLPKLGLDLHREGDLYKLYSVALMMAFFYIHQSEKYQDLYFKVKDLIRIHIKNKHENDEQENESCANKSTPE